MNVQPIARQADLVQAVARVTRVTLTDLLNNTGGHPEDRQALVDLLRGSPTVAARVLEARADGTSVLELGAARVTIRLNVTPAVGDTVLLSMDDSRTPAQQAPEVTLSRSALLINDIKKPVLNQLVNEIVSTTPMTRSADTPQALAQALQKAVRSSGLFYESHLRGWIDGRVALEDLYAEPQARVATAAPALAGDAATARESQLLGDSLHGNGAQGSNDVLPGSEPRHTGESRPVVHPQLEPLVRQQLDTFEQQRIAWHGMLWPDQQAEIVIHGEPQSTETTDPQAPRAWRVQLALNTPTLGTVKADIALTGRRLEVRLDGDAGGINALRKGRAALEHALLAHDLDVHPIRVTGGAA